MKKNPYRQVEHALRVAGKVLLCLVWTVIIGVPVSFVIAFVWTQGGWGAWALTLPIIFVVGILLLMFLYALILWPFVTMKSVWRKRRVAWDLAQDPTHYESDF